MEKQSYLCAGCGTRVEPGELMTYKYWTVLNDMQNFTF